MSANTEAREMRVHRERWLIGVIIIIIIALTSYFLIFARGRQVVAPTYSVGDTWTWSATSLGGENENAISFTRTETITEKKDWQGRETWAFKSTTTDNAGDTASGYSINYNYVGVGGWYKVGKESYSRDSKIGEMIPTGPVLSVEFPLEIGDRWVDVRAASGYDNSRGIESIDVQMITRGEVLSKETVTVPAGTFQAYKIEFTVLLTGTGKVMMGGQEQTARVSTTVTGTRWYSPEVKNFVKEFSDTTVMINILWESSTSRVHKELELSDYNLG